MERLELWKGIADYIGKDVKTAQRWASGRGLPVRRSGKGVKPRVFAYKWEIDEWLHSSSGIGAATGDHEGVSEEQSKLPPGPQRKRLFYDLLQRYYPERELKSHGLFRFRYWVENIQIATNMVTAEPWLGLGIPIDERDCSKFPIAMRSFHWPAALRHEIAQLRAESKKRDIPFHNRPMYCLESFTGENRLIASFSLGQYADYKVKLGRLEQELAQVLIDSDFDPKEPLNKYRSLVPCLEDRAVRKLRFVIFLSSALCRRL